VSGLSGKRVAADVPGLGEVKRRRFGVQRTIRARSRALASRGTVLLRGSGCAREGVRMSSSAAIQRSAQNWHGPGESDCLIKTKHCDGVLRRCSLASRNQRDL
jgi:hypothetical protein